MTPPAVERVRSSAPQQAFSRSLSRLSNALNAFPQQSAVDVLEALARRDHSCAVELTNGNAAVVYGGDKSIAITLDRCAAAVEKLRLKGNVP